jgi:hypothetical protein
MGTCLARPWQRRTEEIAERVAVLQERRLTRRRSLRPAP